MGTVWSRSVKFRPRVVVIAGQRVCPAEGCPGCPGCEAWKGRMGFMASDDVDLDDSIDALYDAPPDAFVAQREALVKQLRQAKRRDDAAAVHALARPTVAAWAVNQALRRAPDLADQLVSSSQEVVEAQRKAVEEGDAAWLRTAQAQRRGIVRQLTDLAQQALEENDRPGENHRDDVSSILEAASLAPDSSETLRRGHLAAVPQAAPIDELAAMFAPTPAPTPTRSGVKPRRASQAREASKTGTPKAGKPAGADPDKAREAAEQRKAEQEAEAQARQALTAAQAEVEATQVRLAQADTQARAAGERVEQAKITVDVLERQLRDARSTLEDAESQQMAADDARHEAERQQQEAQNRLQQAQEAMNQQHRPR